MSETYNIIFGSRNANAINTTNLDAVQYTVNWDNILRNKYKKYNCCSTFITETTGTPYSACGIVNISFGCKMNSFDGTSLSENIGTVYSVLTFGESFYNSTLIDNPSFTMNYPTNNLTIINLRTFTKTKLDSVTNYILTLNMTGIPDDE